jgi:hypothetical protein
VKKDEYALVQICDADKAPVEGDDTTAADLELDGYNVTLIITEDISRLLDSEHSELLKLNYFVVLTRLRDFHPKKTLEKKFGDFRTCASASGHSHSG